MDNTPERLAIIQKMNAMLNEDCAAVWLSHPNAFSLTQPWAPRVNRNPLYFGGPKYARLDVHLREQKRQEWNRPNYLPLWITGGVLLLAVGYGIRWGKRRYV